MSSHIPGRQHYDTRYVVDSRRVYSYAHQIQTTLAYAPARVLEVGVGPGLVAAALRSLSVDITTVDVAFDLRPSTVGSVLQLPFREESFDVSMCCQVLEHLPFENFVPALRELRRVSGSLVLSLPDITRNVSLRVGVRRLGLREFSITLPSRAPSAESLLGRAGHHWEIGCRGHSPANVAKAIGAAGWRVKRTWRVPELAWHRFYDCTR